MESIVKKKIGVILIGILSTIGIVTTIILSISIYKQYSECKKIEIDSIDIASYDASEMYYVDFNGNDTYEQEDFKAFINEIDKISGVEVCGTYDETLTYYKELKGNKEYIELHKELIESEELFLKAPMSNSSELLRMTSKVYNLCDIDIEKGTKYKDYDGEEIPILVGNKYKNVVEVGKVLTDVYTKKKYKIIGVLKENSKWLCTDDISDISIHLNSYVDLDSKFVVIYDEDMLNKEHKIDIDKNSFYVCIDCDNDEEVIDKINRIIKKHKYDCKLMNMEEVYKRLNENIMLDIDNMIVHTILIGVVSLVVLFVFIYTFKKKRK